MINCFCQTLTMFTDQYWCLSYVDDVPGCKALWVVGDNFTARSYRKHFMPLLEPSAKSYCVTHFEVSPHGGSRFESNNTNILAWIQNALAKGLNKTSWLPQYLVMVLDNDLVKYLDWQR